MRRSVVLLALLAACSGEAEVDGVALPYGVGSRPVLPFPTDEVAYTDDGTETKLRLRIDERGKNLGDVDESIFLFGDNFTDQLSNLDGWSTLGPAFLPLGEPPDEATLATNLHLVDLDAQTIVDTRNSAIDGETDYGRAVNWGQMRPRLPLAPATRHAIVATKGLKTAAGRPYVRPAAFDAVWRQETPEGADPDHSARAIQRLEGIAPALAAAGIEADDVLVAEVYTTLSIASHADTLIAAMSKHDATVTITSTAAPLSEGVAMRLFAEFDLPTYRAEDDGPIEISSADDPPVRFETVEVLIVIPEGEGPFPVSLFHHGLGGRKTKVDEIVPLAAPAGVALIAIDAPLHGARTDKPGNAGTRFLNVVAPHIVADNLRQAQADQVYLVSIVPKLAALGLPLDTDRIFYMGESLGAIVGAAVVGLAPEIEGAVLMVGGGTLLEFFDQILSGFEFDGFPTQLFTTVAQTVLDRGDPSNFAHRSRDKQIYLAQGMDDTVVPPGATRSLGIAMGLPIIAPAADAPPGTEVIEGPLEGRGWAQYPDAGHGLFFDEGRPGYEASRAQLLEFVRTWAQTGTGVIR